MLRFHTRPAFVCVSSKINLCENFVFLVRNKARASRGENYMSSLIYLITTQKLGIITSYSHFVQDSALLEDSSFNENSLADLTWPDTTRKRIKTAFYSKIYSVKIVLLVKLTLYGRWPQVFFKRKTTSILRQMEDDLNILSNGWWPQYVGEWKTT